MPKYRGTVVITLDGIFEADGIDEICDDPEGCARNCNIEMEIIDMQEEPDGDWEE